MSRTPEQRAANALIPIYQLPDLNGDALAQTILSAGRAAKATVTDVAANYDEADRRLTAAEEVLARTERWNPRAIAASTQAWMLHDDADGYDVVDDTTARTEAQAAHSLAAMAHEMVGTGTVDVDLATFHAAVRGARFRLNHLIERAQDVLAELPEELEDASDDIEDYAEAHEDLRSVSAAIIEQQSIAAVLQIVDERLTAATLNPTPRPKGTQEDKDTNS